MGGFKLCAKGAHAEPLSWGLKKMTEVVDEGEPGGKCLRGWLGGSISGFVWSRGEMKPKVST
jgi:hypothetical protein